MCILKKTDGPCVKGPGTGGRASQTVAHAVEVRSKHGFGNAPRGKNALTDGRKRVWRPAGAGEDCGEKLQQAAQRERDLRWAGPDLPACRKSRAGEDQGEGQGEGRSRREGPFPLRQGPLLERSLPAALPVEAGNCGRYGQPWASEASAAVTIVLAGKGGRGSVRMRQQGRGAPP